MGKSGRLWVVGMLSGAVILSGQSSAAVSAAVVRTTGGVLPFDTDWPVQPDPKAVTFKEAHVLRAVPDGQGHRHPTPGAQRITAPPPAMTLPTRESARFVEPPGYGTDDRGRDYTDVNYWNICSAGAATVAASYFIPDPTQTTGGFHEPYGPYSITTRWDSSDVDANQGFTAKARAYMLFMAMAVQPPSFDRPGIDDFTTYPTHGGSPQAIRDAINWEISGHLGGGRWSTYFYFAEPNSGSTFTQDRLNEDIVSDIAGAGAPVVVTVDADYLPNWPDLAKPLHHAVSVVGYDNVADTYTYVDTCGRQCGAFSNGGTHEISQAKLFRAIQMVGRVDDNGYLIKRADGTPRYPTGAYIW